MSLKKILPFVMAMFLLAATNALALDANVNEVELEGVELEDDEINSFERDNEFDLSVEVESSNTSVEQENVQVEARIRGYDQNEVIGDITDAFDMKPNVTYNKDLNVQLPVRLEQDRYKMRVSVVDADGEEITETYELEVEADQHEVWIKDVMTNPSNEVEAGRALLSKVRLENVGNKDEDDGIKLTVSIPSLGISASDYIDELEEGESVTSEELYMRLPKCPDLGTHELNVEAVYRDGDATSTETETIEVTGSEVCEVPEETDDTKPSVSVGSEVQEVTAGKGGAIYPVTITNEGKASKTFTISTDVEDWGTVRISPSNMMVVKSGKTQTAYVYVSASEDATPGQNVFGLTVKAGSDFTKQFTMTANVVGDSEEKESSSMKDTLEIGLVVLVIILIILGLIVGLRKMKKKDGDDEEAQTYY